MIIKILCFNSFYIVNKILKYKNRLNIYLKSAESIFAFSRFPFRVFETRNLKNKTRKNFSFFETRTRKPFLVPPQGLCFKSVGNETCQDLTLRTITKRHNNY
jgi:hypothetical protein